jgi:integrase
MSKDKPNQGSARGKQNLEPMLPVGARGLPDGDGDTRIPEGLSIRSSRGIQMAFMWQGQRCFETYPGRPTPSLIAKAAERREEVLQLIKLGKFKYEEEFPESRRAREATRRSALKKVPQTGAALDAWLKLTTDSIGPNTRDDYRRIIAFKLKPMPVAVLGIAKPHPCAGLDLEALPVDELTPERVSALRNHLFRTEGLSVKRVTNILIPLRGMMPALVADGHLRSDPFALLKPLKDTRVQADKPTSTQETGQAPSIAEVAQFKTGKGKADPFAPSEIHAILRHAYGQVLNMVAFWADEGLRPGEVLGLQWQDVDWAARTVTLRRSVSKGNLKDLKAQVAHSGAQRAWVFPNPFTGDRYANESKFNRRWRRLLVAAGVRYRPPKQLRHTTGSTFLSAGVPTIQTAYHLGHKDIGMLARHYGHFLAEVANLPGATYEEKFEPIWAARVELLRTRQQPPGGDDWLGLLRDEGDAWTEDDEEGENDEAED